ncbi:MAG TPA: hypothetical protein VF257_16645 [Solirubrobacteraceae bacterium]
MRSARSSRRAFVGALSTLAILGVPAASAGASDTVSASAAVVTTADALTTTATTTATTAADAATAPAATPTGTAAGAAPGSPAPITPTTTPVPTDQPPATTTGTPGDPKPSGGKPTDAKPSSGKPTAKPGAGKPSPKPPVTKTPPAGSGQSSGDPPAGGAQGGNDPPTTAQPSDPATPVSGTDPSRGDGSSPSPPVPPAPSAAAPSAATPVVVAPVPATIAALPAPPGTLGGSSPAIVRATASTGSAILSARIPLSGAPRRQAGVAILLAGAAPPPTPLDGRYHSARAYESSASPPSAPGPRAKSHTPRPAPAGSAGDERSPRSPAAPPGRGVVAGGASASGGGGAIAMWCAILVGLLAYSARELRRHRFRLVLCGPVGVVSPQQRPG